MRNKVIHNIVEYDHDSTVINRTIVKEDKENLNWVHDILRDFKAQKETSYLELIKYIYERTILRNITYLKRKIL